MSSPANPTTSGTSTYNPAATKVITRAFRIMAVIDDTEDPTAEMMAEGMDALNSLMAELQATGIHVWTEEEGILFLQQYQRRFLLGGDGADHACDANAWTLTTLASAAASGAGSISVSSTSGISEGDNVGVVLGSGAAFWTTAKAAPAGGAISLTNALSAAANAGGFVISYPVSAQLLRPLRIPFARRLQLNAPNAGQTVQAPDWGGIITPIGPMCSRQDYFNLPQPNNPGLVTQTYYNPARDQGEFWVWNVSTDANWAMRFTYYRPIQDFVSLDNVPDLPREWTSALQWNLAEELKLDYSVSPARSQQIAQKATAKLSVVQGWDREPESVYFGRASSQTRG